MVTEYCSLKCKLCLAYVPYYKEKSHMSLDMAKLIFKNYFDTIDSVDKFSVTGGEPLINPQIDEILMELLKYENKINNEIILITNGTILLSKETLQILKSNSKIKVIVNNYGKLSIHAYENRDLLKKNGINNIFYTEDNRYGWIDCRDHSLKYTSLQQREEQAAQCAFFKGKKYVINRGILYTCTRAAYRIQEEIIPYSSNDYIDLINEEMETRKVKLLKLLKLKSTISCAYCGGLKADTPKYKAAEQLE